MRISLGSQALSQCSQAYSSWKKACRRSILKQTSQTSLKYAILKGRMHFWPWSTSSWDFIGSFSAHMRELHIKILGLSYILHLWSPLDIRNTSQQALPYSAWVKLCAKCNVLILTLTMKKGILVFFFEHLFVQIQDLSFLQYQFLSRSIKSSLS